MADENTQVVDAPDVTDSSTTNEGSESNKSPEPSKFDSAALEAKVSAGLKSLDTSTDENFEPAKTADDLTPATETGNEITPVGDQKQVAKLPAAYLRTLKAYEWTDEEIAEQANQPKFLEFAAKLHANRNKETAQWAEMGRRARAEQAAAASGPKQEQTAAAIKAAISKIDVEAVRKTYGDDALVDLIIKPVNAALERLEAIEARSEQSQKVSQQAELDMLGKQIEGFFGSDDVKPHAEKYGSMTVGLNEAQLKERNLILETADALMTGAKIQHRSISLNDALKMALDSFTHDDVKQVAKTEIKKEMKAREKGISLKPGGPKPIDDGKVKTKADLERKVAAGLASVFKT